MKISSKKRYFGQDGISVLFAIVITSIVLVIGVTVSNLVIGELSLVRTADHSIIAFYAANAGMERTLYYCRKIVVANQVFDPEGPDGPTSGWDGLLWNGYTGEGNRLSTGVFPEAAYRITGSCDTLSATLQSTGLYPCAQTGLCEANQRDVSRRSLEAVY